MKISGVQIPPFYSLEGNQLPYQGGALRSKFFVKTYIAMFYSEKKFSNINEALIDDSPKVIRQHVMTNLITGKLLAESFKDGLSKSSISEDPSIQDDLEQMLDFMGKIRVNIHDEMDIVYHPISKLKVFFKGELKLESEKTILAQALMGMFLGEKHPDKTFQKKLIGLK